MKEKPVSLCKSCGMNDRVCTNTLKKDAESKLNNNRTEGKHSANSQSMCESCGYFIPSCCALNSIQKHVFIRFLVLRTIWEVNIRRCLMLLLSD